MIRMRKVGRSFRFAGIGMRELFRSENNARFHAAAAIVVVSVGVGLQISRGDWLWIISAIAFVWVTEALNTAIERLVDLVSPEWNARAGAIKDLAAAAVGFAAIAAVIVGLLVFSPYL